MREYVHLHRKAKDHWVFRDPFRWHLFSFLLMEADETGRVEVSVNEYSKMFGIERTKVMRILREMVDRSIIAQQTHNKFTIITICNYELYNEHLFSSCTTNAQQDTNLAPSREEKKEERERKFPPHPLIKKEKSEKREELSATSLRRESENEGQGLLFQELKEEHDGAAVNDASSTPKAPSTEDPETPTFEQFWDAYAYKRDRRAAERACQRHFQTNDHEWAHQWS